MICEKYDKCTSTDCGTCVYSINNMSVSDITHWCATHPDPKIKKQFEEELAKYNELKKVTDNETD